MYNDLIHICLTMYLLVLPIICNLLSLDSKDSFLKFYFTKSERVNWLGFTMFIILCSGSLLWYCIFEILNIIFIVIILPIMWIFEFLFLNKDCSGAVSKELQNKLNGENND